MFVIGSASGDVPSSSSELERNDEEEDSSLSFLRSLEGIVRRFGGSCLLVLSGVRLDVESLSF